MKVWVTRDESRDGPLTAALRGVGLDPILEPVIERRVVDDAREVIARLGHDDWLVLTSVYAIEAVAAEPARIPRVAVVGEVSAKAARARGFRVQHISKGSNAPSLLEELRGQAKSGKVCYPRSSLVSPPDPWSQVDLLSPVLYETTPRAFDRSIVERVDVVAVASASAVNVIGKIELPFASIGPATSEALRRLGIEPWVEALARSYESLASAIADQASDSCHQRA